MSASPVSRPSDNSTSLLPRRREKSGTRRDDPQFENRRPYSEPVRHGSYTRSVTNAELDQIVGRITKPTVSSRGGVDIRDKDFTYIKPRPQKTLIVIPGLDRRYQGLKKVNRSEMQQIVARLTRMTTAYTAKFSVSKHVWVDDSPRRERFRPKSVV